MYNPMQSGHPDDVILYSISLLSVSDLRVKKYLTNIMFPLSTQKLTDVNIEYRINMVSLGYI